MSRKKVHMIDLAGGYNQWKQKPATVTAILASAVVTAVVITLVVMFGSSVLATMDRHDQAQSRIEQPIAQEMQRRMNDGKP